MGTIIVGTLNEYTRAVAMMEIDIENRYSLRAAVDKPLRRDRRVVEKAIAAIHVMVAVMTGRPA